MQLFGRAICHRKICLKWLNIISVPGAMMRTLCCESTQSWSNCKRGGYHSAGFLAQTGRYFHSSKCLKTVIVRQTMYTQETVSKDDPLVRSLYEGILAGDRSSLARGITLAETFHPRKKAQAQALLAEVLEHLKTKSQHSDQRPPTFRIGWYMYICNSCQVECCVLQYHENQPL